MEKEEVKKTTLAVSYAILEGRWNDLDSLKTENTLIKNEKTSILALCRI